MNSALATGRVVASVTDATLGPPHQVARNPVVYLHSLGGDASQTVGVTGSLPATRYINRAICEQGFTFVAVTADGVGTSGLPSDTALSGGQIATYKGRVDAAIDYHRTNLGGTGPPVIVCQSQGFINACVWALETDDPPACIVVANPAWDLENTYTNDVAGLRSSIEIAWGVTHPATLPTEAQIQTRAAELAGIPILGYYASDDPHAATISTFVSASGATMVNVGAVGHDNDTTQAVVDDHLTDVTDFIRDNT